MSREDSGLALSAYRLGFERLRDDGVVASVGRQTGAFIWHRRRGYNGRRFTHPRVRFADRADASHIVLIVLHLPHSIFIGLMKTVWVSAFPAAIPERRSALVAGSFPRRRDAYMRLARASLFRQHAACHLRPTRSVAVANPQKWCSHQWGITATLARMSAFSRAEAMFHGYAALAPGMETTTGPWR